jgi:hypothetical protein
MKNRTLFFSSLALAALLAGTLWSAYQGHVFWRDAASEAQLISKNAAQVETQVASISAATADFSQQQVLAETAGIGGTPDADAVFDVVSTTQASRPWPTLDTTQRNAITTPVEGLIVFNSDQKRLNIRRNNLWRIMSTATDNRLFVAAVQGNYNFDGQFIVSQPGTHAVSSDTTGIFTQETTGAGGGSNAGIQASNYNMWRINQSPIFVARIKTSSDISNQRIWCGMFGSASSSSDTAPNDALGFRYSTAASDTTWKFISRSGGGTQVVADTGVTVSASTEYVLAAIYRNDTSLAYFSVNQGTLTTVSTGLPAATTAMAYDCVIFNVAAGTRAFNIRSIFCTYDN